jgi:hypothetical protein
MNTPRHKFNRGFVVYHQEEIETAKALHDACVLLHGRRATRRLLRTNPAAVFKPLRYGRAVTMTPDGGMVRVMIDGYAGVAGKAGNDHIAVPGRPGWSRVRRRVGELMGLARWADGMTATAEALDDLGFAVAESIAAIMAFDMIDDADVGVVDHAKGVPV